MCPIFFQMFSFLTFTTNYFCISTPSQSSSIQNALTLRVKLNLSKYFVEKNQMELADPWELDLLKPIELMIWSIPFFLWSKNIAPQRLTIRSAFSWKIMKSLNQNAKREYLNQGYEQKKLRWACYWFSDFFAEVWQHIQYLVDPVKSPS